MNENDKIIDASVSKKIGEYSPNEARDNFVLPHELTVTITLSEYRDLITAKASREGALAKRDREVYKLLEENRQLKNENDLLVKKIARIDAEAVETEEK
jgi:hypothetical protein